MSPSDKSDVGKLIGDDNPSLDLSEEQLNSFNFENLDDLFLDFTSPPVQSTSSRDTEFQLKEDEKGSDFASLGILKDLPSRSRKMNGEKIHVPCSTGEDLLANDKKLSTTARIRMAGQHFIDSYSSKSDEYSQLSHPFSVSFSGLYISDDEAKDIELLLTLLASAEKTGQKQFNRAIKLIQLCNNISLTEGNPVERLVYYFSEAIHMKINHEMGKVAREGLENMQMFDLQDALMNVHEGIFAFHQKIPLSQVCQFSAVNTITESLRNARKIHLTDLEIRTGMQYIVMMQAIASQSGWCVDLMKITAICSRTESESKIQDTCKRLDDYAKSMKIPFSFKIVVVADLLDFNIDLLELDAHDKVAVYAPFFLSYLIVKPDRLEHLMRMIRKINPCVTVITEVEANHTSPAFVNRFIEALFFYGALFDSMSDCLANDLNRKFLESVFYGHAIRNIVAADGDERTIRHIGIIVWRKFFQRFGMMEIELSDVTLNEAKLLIGSFKCGNSCSLVVDVGCFLIGWKGVPIFSVSARKFK